MKNRKELVKNIIKEAIGGDISNISTSVNMITYKDNPLVQELVKILDKEFKKEDAAELQFIHENGDIWEFGIRFEIQEPSQQMQFTREIAKSKAYEIKRKLEELLMPKFNIPSFSIQGVRTMKSKEGKVYCDCSISLIYANKDNLKVTYESYNRLVESVIEAELDEAKKNKKTLGSLTKEEFKNLRDNGKLVSVIEDYLENNMSTSDAAEIIDEDPDDADGTIFEDVAIYFTSEYKTFKQALESYLDADIEIPTLDESEKFEFDNEQPSHTSLEKAMRDWEIISKQIKKHEEDFKTMIEEKLKTESVLKEKIFRVMGALDVKTKKVDKIVAKIKSGGIKVVGPTPTEKVAILMSKLNEATKKVVEKEFDLLSKDVPFSAHKSIAVEEGIGDKIKSGYEYIKSKLSPWFTSLKDMFNLTDELEKEVNNLSLTEDFQDLDSLTKIQEPTGKSPYDRFKQEDVVNYVAKYPGTTESEIYKNVYGYRYNKVYGWSAKKAADLIRRALDAGKIIRTKELKKGKATWTYWIPEDYNKFVAFQKEKGVRNIKLKNK